MMAYDSRADRFVSFGGSDGDPTNQTWIFDAGNSTWTLVYPMRSPPARVDGAMVYDSREDAVVLFGGWWEPADEVYLRLGDTWTFYLGNDTWVPRTPAHNPQARSDAAIGYDSRDDILLMYGGFNGTAYLGDTWEYVFAADDWVPVQGYATPPARADGRMAYDPSTNALYLFGGNDYSGPNFTFHHLNDTWRYDPIGRAWTRLAPSHSPGARDYAVFATDTRAGELLSFGGFGENVVLGELWAFNTTQLDWRNLTAPGGPSPRMAAVGGYTPVEDAFLVFSGADKVSIKNDTWSYRFPGPLAGAVTASASMTDVGSLVTFQGQVLGGSGSYPRLLWDFGDGGSATGSQVSHRFQSPGVFTVLFHAFDDMGNNVTVAVFINVNGSLAGIVSVALAGSGAALLVAAYVLYKRRRPPSESH